MSELKVVSGRPSALWAKLADRVAGLRRDDPLAPIWMLVGASLQRPWLQRQLAARLGAHANVRILMPGDLALLLGAPALVAAQRRALPPLADRVLLADVAGAHSGYFAPVADTPGFALALYRLVRELKGAGYPVGALGPLLSGATDAPAKASALAEILATFEARRRYFYGPDDALLAADPARLDGLGLLVWGVVDLSSALERLLGQLAERLPVDIFIPDVPSLAGAPLGDTRQRLLLGGAVEQAAQAADSVGALREVSRRLFEPPTGPAIPADDTLRLVSAPDPAREVRAVARACLQWASEGVPFWEMAVAYRHGEAYRPLVEAVFIEARIPLYLHEGSPLSERPLGRQTLALLDLFDTDLSRQSVMDFLTDARFPSELGEEYGGWVPAARWDSVSRQAGIVGKAEQWASRLEALIRELLGDPDEDPPDWVAARVADARQLAAFIAELDTRLRANPGRAAWAVHLEYLRDLLLRYVKGAQEVIEALRGLERFTALEEQVDFRRFLDTVRRAIGTIRSEDVLDGTPGAFARRGVNVVAVNSLPGIEFRRVWILGATERAFPPPSRQDPILLDGERAEIARRAGLPLPARGARGSEEELIFALAVEAARERLVVSYARRATGESRPRLPSIFFRELASQLAGERISAERAPMLSHVDRIPGDAIAAPIPGGRYASTRADVHDAAAAAISDADRDRTFLQALITRPAAVAVYERAAPAFARAITADGARRSRGYSEWDGALGPDALPAVAQLLGENRVYSPSSLEDYAACPQRFLMGSLLRIRAIAEPETTVRIDALRRGNLFHRILERFHGEWDGPGAAALADVADERMRAIARQESDLAAERGETGYVAMWRADRIEVLEDCLHWLAEERRDPLTRQLPLARCEVRFGSRYHGEQSGPLSRDAPVEIELPGRTLRLSGRIDRISFDRQPPDRYRVSDYKTGKVYDGAARLHGGRTVQLPLYVLAAAQLLSVDADLGEAAYVYPTRRGDFRTIPWTGSELEARHEDLTRVLGAILDGIASGDFMIAPFDERGACTYCDFKPICPRGPHAYMERRSTDPRLSAFAERIRAIE